MPRPRKPKPSAPVGSGPAWPKAAYKGRWGVGPVRVRAATFDDQKARRLDRAQRRDLKDEGHGGGASGGL